MSEQIRHLPLKAMDPMLLRSAIVTAAEVAGTGTSALIHAMDIAGFGHRGQTRANRGDLPRVHYIEHPLRNTLRLQRYGVTNQDVLVASVLHDTVEDCAIRLHEGLLWTAAADESEARLGLLNHYNETFGAAVAEIVAAVTNELPVPGVSRQERNSSYVAHVIRGIEDPRVFAVKFSDFVDNALSLHHTLPHNEPMVHRLATKYLPLVTEFENRLTHRDLLEVVPETGIQQMREHLSGSRLAEFVA